MKKLTSLFVSMAAAAMALVSCQIVESVVDAPAEEAVTIRVHASANDLKSDDPATKTYIDNTNTIIWGEGEYMKLALTAGETTTFATSTDASADTFDGQPSATFEFSVSPAAAAPYTYQGIYPASAAATSSNTNAANYKVNLPAIQNATASSYDPAAYIMVAEPKTFDAVQTDWVASFRRGTALNKITLKNFASSVSINKVKITAEGKKLAGGRHFNLTTGESLEVYGTDATIDVLYASPLTGTTMDVWFTSWDTEIAEGEKLTIVAYTTDSKSYTKEITVPAGKSIKFQEGYLNTLGATFGGIDPENVTSLDGDYVILAENSGNYYALKGEASGTRIASVNYTGSTSSYAGDASLIWTIATSGNGYTIKNGSNFIGWTKDNTADLVDENDYDATKCLMGIGDNGDGTYKIYVAADATRILARNQSNAYFAFYTGSGYKDLILVPATTLEQVATPTFDTAAGEVTSGTEVAISCATGGATIHYTVDGTDPTSSSASYSSPIEITATTTIKAIAVKDGMADSEIATATYSVASAGSVTLTSSDITAGDNTVEGTNNSALAYRLGTGSNNGSLTFPSGYSSITFTLAGWASGTRSFSITNGTINGDDSLSPAAGSPSGTINAGFSGSYTGTEYTIVVDDPTQEVVFSGRRCVVWGFTAVPAAPVTPKVATPTFSISGSEVSISCATEGATIYYSLNGANVEEYSAPIDISGSNSATIEAFAEKTDYEDSDVAGEIYYAVNVYATTNGSVTAVPFAAQDDEVSLTVTPESGYALDHLSVLDENDDPVAVTNNKFTMPASPVFVTATFAQNVVSYDFETVAELNALVTSTSTEYSGYLTDAVVSFVPATNMAIVKDATGSVMIYKSSHGLKQGQTYTGAINVTAVLYTDKNSNSLYSEITAWDATFVGEEAVVAPESVSLANLIGHYDAYQNAYVQVAGLTVSSVDGKNINVTDGANDYVVYDNTSSVSVAAGDVITAVGTVTKYQTTEEIKVWNAADVIVTASAPKAITFSQPAAGGSFTVSVGGSNITSGTTVASGTTVTLTATAGTDYEFTSWTVEGATVANASATTTTFVMGTSAVTVSAAFTSTGYTPSTYVDVLTQSWTGVSGTNYSGWTGKAGSASSAVYAGNSAGGNSSIQLRSNNNNSGVVSTTSGGKVKKIKVTWNSNTTSGRTLNIYGKNSAYSQATDLYNSSNQGTLLGTIVCGTSTELTITGDYTYIGFRSASGAMYLDEVDITWEN